MSQTKKKSIWTRWWMIAIYAIVGLGVIGNLLGGGDDAAAPATTPSVAAPTEPSKVPTTEAAPAPTATEKSSPTPTETVAEVADVEPADEPEEEEVVEPEEPELTIGQANAVGKAMEYLDYSAFSRKGLIGQLEYEGFDTEDAEFAVDYLDVNWKEQAAKKAQEYMDYSSFSKKGLLDQLEYEGFTAKQAKHGVKAVGF